MAVLTALSCHRSAASGADAGCPLPPPGTATEVDAPVLQGTRGHARLGEWLEARGVNRRRTTSWLEARFGRQPQGPHDLDASCERLSVGDEHEEAILCQITKRVMLEQARAVGIVVRAEAPVSVLDVGLNVVAMDFPERRWLDLSVVVAGDGLSLQVRDRAPNGTLLVESPAQCAARGSMPMIGYPAVLHDCAGAIPELKSGEGEDAKSVVKTGFTAARAFAEASCAERGDYRWTKGRFERADE